MAEQDNALRIGWSSVEITPDRPVCLAGQFHVRVSEGVRDPITATAMAFESVRDGGVEGRGVMVSCDLLCITDPLRDAVREILVRDLPELDPRLVFFNATHTHTAPEIYVIQERADDGGLSGRGIDLDVMSSEACIAQTASRIADAVVRAWNRREPSGIGFGLGHATIGYNRRICYYNGQARMYGNPATPEFSHVEAGSDTSIHLLYTWSRSGKLTGVVVNVACPSQCSESEYKISADYWHEARQEIRRRLGDDLFILPQCSPAGDIVPGRPVTMMDAKAQERMWRLMGLDQRRDIGRRIAETAAAVLPYAQREIVRNPTVRHRVETVALSRRKLTERDVADAAAQAQQVEEKYQALKQELEAHPKKRQAPRWYKEITEAYRRARWNRAVADRFELEKREPNLPVEIHVLRIGDVAIATNPFELYLDFGQQIKARSHAVQTLLVQLAGPGSYVPTLAGTQGGAYGAIPASTPVGPEGGRELVNWTVDAINAMWRE